MIAQFPNPSLEGVHMNRSTTTTLRRPLARAALGAALLAAALAPAAEAAVPKTGTWNGDHSQVLDSLGVTVPFKTTMVITALEGRIATVVGTVRMECPSIVGVRDARVVESWRRGTGPRVSSRGGFRLRADGAYIHGTLSRSSAIGGSLATYGSGPDGPLCRGTGRFNLQRRRY
jgi:hypothetical protein